MDGYLGIGGRASPCDTTVYMALHLIFITKNIISGNTYIPGAVYV
jgi:hypothetical protein